MARTLASNRGSSLNRVNVSNFPSSLSFNSTTTIVVLTQTSGLPVFSQSGYSVAGKFKTFFTTQQTLYGEANTANNTQFFAVQTNTSKMEVFVRNNANVAQLNGVKSDSLISLNAWHDFVWIDSNGTCKLWIDGVLDTHNFNYTPATPYTFNASSIGETKRLNNAFPLKGNMCGVQLFNYALSPFQVQQVRNGQLLGNVGSYPLTEGAGTTAYDLSGNGNNGTITGGTYTSDVPSKTRQLVGGNMVYNGNFSFIPPVNVATTTQNRFVDGTSGGSTTNSLFGYKLATGTGSCAALYGQSNTTSGSNSLKVSTTATSSKTIITSNAITVSPSTSYTASYWMQTVANSGAATSGAYLDMQEQNAAGSTQADNNGTKVATTNGLTQYTLTFTTNAATTQIVPTMFVTGNDGTGTLIMDAWFSGITLLPVVNTTRGNV